jgi:hypothetical protein
MKNIKNYKVFYYILPLLAFLLLIYLLMINHFISSQISHIPTTQPEKVACPFSYKLLPINALLGLPVFFSFIISIIALVWYLIVYLNPKTSKDSKLRSIRIIAIIILFLIYLLIINALSGSIANNYFLIQCYS